MTNISLTIVHACISGRSDSMPAFTLGMGLASRQLRVLLFVRSAVPDGRRLHEVSLIGRILEQFRGYEQII